MREVTRLDHVLGPGSPSVPASRVANRVIPSCPTGEVERTTIGERLDAVESVQTRSIPGVIEDRRPRPDFVKAYMHNGYLKSLEEVWRMSQPRPFCAR